MKKLGYIITNRKNNNFLDCIDIINPKELTELSKPSLIIGLDNAKKLISNFSILQKKTDKDIFWTFNKTENRVDYERDINIFYEYIFNKAFNNIKYYYINLITIKLSTIKKIISILKSNIKKYIYINKNMVYVLYDNIVLGFSLKLIEYCKINKDKFLKYFYNCNNSIIKDTDSFIELKYKRYIKDNYILPFFIYLYN